GIARSQDELSFDELGLVLLEVLDIAVHALHAARPDPLGGDAASGAVRAVGARAARALRAEARHAVVPRAEAVRDGADGPLGAADEAGADVNVAVGVDSV